MMICIETTGSGQNRLARKATNISPMVVSISVESLTASTVSNDAGIRARPAVWKMNDARSTNATARSGPPPRKNATATVPEIRSSIAKLSATCVIQTGASGRLLDKADQGLVWGTFCPGHSFPSQRQ